jgi:hypothetical protein
VIAFDHLENGWFPEVSQEWPASVFTKLHDWVYAFQNVV